MAAASHAAGQNGAFLKIRALEPHTGVPATVRRATVSEDRCATDSAQECCQPDAAMGKTDQVRLVQRSDVGDPLLVYATPRGAKVELPYKGETIWASQRQMAQMFDVSVANVSSHLIKIFKHGELQEEAVIKEELITAADGKTYPTKLYNLNAIISVGYRVESRVGTAFRIWATDILIQILTKGFYVDAERLKESGDYDRIRELRETIRDIRSSEANLYAELRRICAMCKDYDGTSRAAHRFYSHMQAKLFHAVTSQTPSEILKSRINASSPNLGLRTWPKDEIRQADALVAKNALAEAEIRELNRVTDILLSVFEDQLDLGRLVVMADARNLLDQQLKQLGRPILRGGGSILAEDAQAHAKAQYRLFDERRRLERKQQADAELAALRAQAKKLPRERKK